MNKNDIVLISLLLIGTLLFIVMFQSSSGNQALVYYENELILTIDLNKEETNYKVLGALGEVQILAGNGKIKVVSEQSSKHLCSKQGYISAPYEEIICLPNKIVIKIISDEYDATL